MSFLGTMLGTDLLLRCIARLESQMEAHTVEARIAYLSMTILQGCLRKVEAHDRKQPMIKVAVVKPLNLGGDKPGDEARKFKPSQTRAIKELTESEIKSLEVKWRSGKSTIAALHDGKVSKRFRGAQALKALGLEAQIAQVLTESDPTELRCVVCRKVVYFATATWGKAPRFGLKREIIQIDPELIEQSKPVIMGKKAPYCPDCAHHIPVALDREGRYKGHNTDYVSLEEC